MLHRAHRETVVPIVVVLRIDSTTVEVQVPSVAGRVERSRPVVAVGTTVVPRRPSSVARGGKVSRCFFSQGTDAVIVVSCRLARSHGRIYKAPARLLFFPRPTDAGRATYELVCILAYSTLS